MQLEAPVPNPLNPYAIEIALVMQSTADMSNVDAMKVRGALYGRLEWQSPVRGGLFEVCLRGLTKDITAAGGPGEYLNQLRELHEAEETAHLFLYDPSI